MMTLGDLIDALPNSDTPVYFAFCSAFPVLDLDSYRGYYERAALDWFVRRRSETYDDTAPRPPKSCDLLAYLRSRLGTTMEGYKGGTYTINRDTLMHVDGNGEVNDTAISSVEVKSWAVIIHTETSE